MSYNEDDYLQLSGIQHFLFCRRQWALIHIENQWKENFLTTEGNILHEKAHNEGSTESRGSTLIMRGLRVSSSSLGISGQCDVVEFHRDEKGIQLSDHEGTWSVYPIEYKHGSPKPERYDEAQLCAEAMCLEEMLRTEISCGALFYGEVRRRTEVVFSKSLRESVAAAVKEMHEYYSRGYTPKSKTGSWCKSCSLKEVCIPTLMRRRSVEEYVKGALCENS
ncbi:MAG: CRISPR-associated protein Cas4 [Lachnospiraceae bacterium]|nr:CRISPR-associated protein Cas4 [Lachnospiraceae bacterium]